MMGDAGPGPVEAQAQVELPGFGLARVDFLLAGVVVIEADGRSAHDSPSAVYRDRHRHEALQAAGFVVVRVTWEDVTRHPEATVLRILAALARSRPADVRVRVDLAPRLLLPLAA